MMATLAELIEARDGLAVIMSYCDDEEASIYVPIFERLEREVAAAEARQDTISRARRLAERKRAGEVGMPDGAPKARPRIGTKVMRRAPLTVA